MRRLATLCFFGGVFLPAVHAMAKTPALNDAQAQLQAAQTNAQTHKDAAAAAKAKARTAAAKAALLAEQQIAAAASVRKLEDQTGDAASKLAALQAQAETASAALQDNEAALTKLLPVMQRLSAQPAGTMLAMPGSPSDAVRGILVMQGIASMIEKRAEAVKQQSAQVASLISQSHDQQVALASAIAAQQKAETALTNQIAAAKADEMADAATALNENAAAITADHRIRGIQGIIDRLKAPPPAPPTHINVKPGGAGAPVAGAVVQNFGDNTVAGPAVGVSYQAVPGARVVTPCAGPVLFADKFQSYGLVVIVDCSGGYDFVLAGMQRLDVSIGQRLSRGQPVGEMPASGSKNPVLYVELRQNGAPVNPASWLNSGGAG